MTLAVGYTRLSQDSDISIQRQKEHIESYADDHGFTLDRIYNDGEQSSGFETDELDEYFELRDRIVQGDVSAVIVNAKRRLARDENEVMRFVADLRSNDVELHTHQDGQVDLSEPIHAAIEIFRAAAAAEEKRKEIERAVEATEDRIAAGKWQGGAPFGTHFPDDGDDLEKYDTEWDTLVDVLQMLEDEVPYSEIAEQTGLSKGGISKINKRGREFYEEYGDIRTRGVSH